jgi:serine/threonine protein kinase
MKDEYIMDLKDYLGGGGFGQVYGGICKSTKDPVAIKIIDKTPFINQMSEKTPFHSEITLMANINHPGISKMFSIYEEENKVSYKVLFCYRKFYNLFQYIDAKKALYSNGKNVRR